MADTQRSIAALKLLHPDNMSGSISPQDNRDLIETLAAGHGEMYVSTPAATSFSETTSFMDIAGTYTLSANNHHWVMSTNGQLKFTGTADRICHIAVSVSLTSSANNQVIHMAVAKTGSTLTPSIIQRKIGTGADIGSTALHAFTDVSTDDYLTLQVRNTSWSAAETVTFETANFFVMSMPL